MHTFTITETVTRDVHLNIPQVRPAQHGLTLTHLTLEQADLIVLALQAELRNNEWLSNEERENARHIVQQFAFATRPESARIELSTKEREILRKLIEQNTFIQAIRFVRTVTGAGLRVSKHYCEVARDAINRDMWED